MQVAQDIQYHRSVALPLLPKTTLVHGPMSLFLTLALLPWHSMAAPPLPPYADNDGLQRDFHNGLQESPGRDDHVSAASSCFAINW